MVTNILTSLDLWFTNKPNHLVWFSTEENLRTCTINVDADVGNCYGRGLARRLSVNLTGDHYQIIAV